MHLYRDGAAWQVVYIPWTRFTEIKVVKNGGRPHDIDWLL
jgi:hypothetical protein